ncbi:hypothetical protein B0T26DRAFT_800140 [Lasiosphaeria miniovina]|uniref:Uncharacterized protein n=1 Tax=Lasiosphaeria miniovina TaxID=1954250 RepID=A0AA40B637_9PEZI|nr:uncharacterized protein B0T26DRAFT_800140 [Lasiosphaeria miniovina]KAK0728367.1 hypothetical protein B0T26DRAFT_800140 [Lasiosphaeria miniovina]
MAAPASSRPAGLTTGARYSTAGGEPSGTTAPWATSTRPAASRPSSTRPSGARMPTVPPRATNFRGSSARPLLTSPRATTAAIPRISIGPPTQSTPTRSCGPWSAKSILSSSTALPRESTRRTSRRPSTARTRTAAASTSISLATGDASAATRCRASRSAAAGTRRLTRFSCTNGGIIYRIVLLAELNSEESQDIKPELEPVVRLVAGWVGSRPLWDFFLYLGELLSESN